MVLSRRCPRPEAWAQAEVAPQHPQLTASDWQSPQAHHNYVQFVSKYLKNKNYDILITGCTDLGITLLSSLILDYFIRLVSVQYNSQLCIQT